MKKKRIFIAVPVSVSVKEKILDLQREIRDWEGVKWEPKEKLHITLYFLGYLSESQVVKVKNVLAKVGFEKFKAVLLGFCFFPSKKRPRVVCLDIESHGKTEKLQQMIGRKLKKFKFFKPEKRKFRAHLTFGRIKKINEIQVKMIEKKLIKGSWKIDKFELMESILRGRKGSIYKII